MSGNGNSPCYYEMSKTKRLSLETKEIGETMSKFRTLQREWDSIGVNYHTPFTLIIFIDHLDGTNILITWVLMLLVKFMEKW